MTMRSWWLRLRALFRRNDVERELREELDFHVAMQARKHRDAGLSPDEAERLARLELGNVELVKEDHRDVRGVRPLEDFIQDVRYAVRGLLRAPVFALAVIVTIGLGVGINASVFTIFDAYVLRPFDVRDPYALYSAQWADRSGHVHSFTANDYDALRRPNDFLSDVAGYQTFEARLGAAISVGDAVTPNFFELVGVRPALGRTLIASDQSAPLVVLSHSTWRTRFAGDSAVIGRRVLIRGYPFQIVGVAQPDFAGLFKKPREFWIPLGALSAIDTSVQLASRDREVMSFVLRLAPNASESQAAAAIASALQASTTSLPDSSRFSRVFLSSRATAIPQSWGAYLEFAPIGVAFALILALACANVANMLLARGLARQRELGTRLALGAPRSRLIRQLMTESIVLALPAVGIGCAIAWLTMDIGVRTLFATLPPDLTAFVHLVPLHVDIRVLFFAFGLTLASTVLFGLIPALQTTRLSVADATRGNFFGETSPARLRGSLVVGQIAVASLLLIVAAMLLRRSVRLGETDLGLRTTDVLTIELEPALRSSVLAAINVNPSVATVAAAASLPLDMAFPEISAMPSRDSTTTAALYNRVSASYFDVLGISIVNGRAFTEQEERLMSPSVIVSEAAAHRLWPGDNPLGKSIRLARFGTNADTASVRAYQNAIVVGVAKDVVVRTVTEGADATVLYFPTSIAANGCCLLARVHGDPTTTKRALDTELERVVPGGVQRMDRLETFAAGAVYPYRAAYWVSLMLGIVALALTVIGVYGVVSYAVGQRIREFGIRIALGATSRDVTSLVLEQALRQALTGAAIGLVLALGVGRILASTLPSMPAFDVLAFAAALPCVVLACVLAAFLPSRRAVRVDPTQALRSD